LQDIDIGVKGGVVSLTGTDQVSVAFQECAAAAISRIRIDKTQNLKMSFPLGLPPIVGEPANAPTQQDGSSSASLSWH
jgi:hypothetical protein